MEQLERVRRYLERIRAAYDGVPFRHDGRDYYEDDVYSFFIHCYHLADWIVALHTSGVARETVNDFINGHHELRVCADLCNGTKHCRLERKRTAKQPFVAGHNLQSSGRVVDSSDGSVRPEITRCQYDVATDGEWYDALELAERCMSLWDRFIEDLPVAS
jgi:hypothetical protein